MRGLIVIINGLVAGAGSYAYLNAETWAGSMLIVLVASVIVLWGEFLRRTLGGIHD